MKKPTRNPIQALILKAFAILSVCFTGAVSLPAETLKVAVNAGTQALPEYETSTTFIKVDLEGIRPNGHDRAPLNIALVIDRSGSMSGQKIEDAKNAAIYVIRQLQKNDIVSVVTYSDSVEVLIPATKVSDKNGLINRVRNIRSDGNTALFAGVSKGAAEVRKFIDKHRINRVILLSDGLANVGPSSPRELGQLGHSLARESISVSTLGIGYGYNEDLMTKLAYNSDGNHVFVENSSELADIFSQELGELFTVTAKEICIRIKVSEDLEIIRFLGREGDIRGNIAEITLNQVADKQEKYVMLEVRHDPSTSNNRELFASVDIDYLNPFKAKREQTSQRYVFDRVADSELVEASVNKNVIKDATLQIATLNTERAVQFRDEGKLKEAEEAFEDNAALLGRTALRYDLDGLSKAAQANEDDAESVYDEARWDSKRKQLREEQTTVRTSQSIGSKLNRYIDTEEVPVESEPEVVDESEKEK
jgi:Ca-activated chloride channel family protein